MLGTILALVLTTLTLSPAASNSINPVQHSEGATTTTTTPTTTQGSISINPVQHSE